MAQPPKDPSTARAFADAETTKDPMLVETRVNPDEMFTLIDGILPFEACLYYQVLPLSIEGSRLNLGMVNLGDFAAAEYVRRQISYINYSVVSWQISSDWHRDSLSRYLSHSAKVKQLRHRAAVVEPEVSSTPNADAYLNSQATLVVDSPDELERELLNSDHEAGRWLKTSTERPLQPQPPEPVAAPQPPEPAAAPQTETAAPPPVVVPAAPHPLELVVQGHFRSLPLESLSQLSSKAMMEALLSRVLEEGIGRLYFEKHADYGRVLWSKDGVVQSALERIKPDVFQGVINELKRMTHLSMISLTKAKQVEIERLYQGDRVLLRFRVMPSARGEEATLQVLRGTALRFYQQQQIDNLGRDALSIAQTLQQRLDDIRERARQTLNFSAARQETLPAIIQMLRQMETQIQEMMQLVAENEEGQSGAASFNHEL